ncbi:MBL fold metallo-hydrolase [Anaeromyxobacter dehalogenans]|uniref:Beta-lactamase-like protein n=1 Tax=Anaeromyxobacter dehalogenans (strain 2CP-C) TaxID=290397 RepID=Q2IK68_ANADE|nr:MBL fold metallo-hydrolase [Anaeromyxobacter dehalogenans]ABC82048.1 Beta-lactamase-like protein [Anaeromyxobacter dehalogenans 2CP-C]
MARALATLLAALAAAGPAPARAADPVLAPIRLAPRVWLVQGDPGVASAANRGFNSNAAFVVTGDGVVVIDALGTPALGRALVRAIRKVTRQPIRRVILTHYHADHVYGLGALKAAGAEVWASAEGRAYLEGEEAAKRLEQRREALAPWFDAGNPLLPADRWLDADAAFELGGARFEVVRLGPAHSPEDLMVVLPDDGVVFSGDVIFAGRIPFVGEADSRRWLAAIDRLLERRPKLLVSGHGPASRDPATHLALTRDYLRHLRAVMGAAVQDLVPFEEAYAAADWSAYAKLPAFEPANRINAYGTYLTMEREMLEAGRR